MGYELCKTMNDIPYGELQDGYSGTVSSGSNSGARRKIIADWEDVPALIDYILYANSVTGLNLTYGIPHPLLGGIYASDVSIAIPDSAKPVGDGYTQVILDITYRPLAFDPLAPAVVRETDIQVIADLQTIPERTAYFENDPKNATLIDTDFVVCQMAYKVTLKGVTSVDMGAVCNSLNKVHDGSFTVRVGSNTYSLAGDQVVYNGIDGVKSQYTSNSSGSVLKTDVTHCFLLSPISLTKIYNPYSNAPILKDRYQETKPPKYEKANLMALGV